MVNLQAFLKKHYESAVNRGVSTALEEATQETVIWSYSKVLGHFRDELERLIWEDEWDIAVVLDATRWDLWQAVYPDHGWLNADGSAWSVGSCSPEWYGNTFDPERVPDERVGVVTANPFAAKPAERVRTLEHTPLHQNPAVEFVDYVFQDSWGCEVGGGYLDVTHPAAVTDRAWKAWRKEDLDRLVVHYMQPHIPFRSRPEWFGERENLQHFGEAWNEDGKEIWKRLRDNEVRRADVVDAYADNLAWGLEHVQRLQRAVEGKILITSDHGNGMGEWGVYSHPPEIRIPALRKVPWITVEGAALNVLEEVDYSASDPGEKKVPIDEQLEALGYR